MKFKLAALGGTFDHLHIGHEFFLNQAFKKADYITIGLVSDRLVTSLKDNNGILPFNKRKKELGNYLAKHNLTCRAKIIKLNDFFGPTKTDSSYQAIFVTSQTKKRAQIINWLRTKNNLLPLKIIQIPLVLDKSGKIISSKDIRSGWRSRQGVSYKEIFSDNIIINKNQRREFRKPLGKILKNPPTTRTTNLIILVGDLALKRFQIKKASFDIAIFDLKIQRKPQILFSNKFIKKADYKVINQAGTIKKTLVQAIISCIKRKKGIIRVYGEEDLAAVPAILLSPLNTQIFYGQPNKGLVKIIVNEKIKIRLLKLFSSEITCDKSSGLTKVTAGNRKNPSAIFLWNEGKRPVTVNPQSVLPGAKKIWTPTGKILTPNDSISLEPARTWGVGSSIILSI